MNKKLYLRKNKIVRNQISLGWKPLLIIEFIRTLMGRLKQLTHYSTISSQFCKTLKQEPNQFSFSNRRLSINRNDSWCNSLKIKTMQVQNREMETIRLFETFTTSERPSIEALPEELNLVSMWKYRLEIPKKSFFQTLLDKFWLTGFWRKEQDWRHINLKVWSFPLRFL